MIGEYGRHMERLAGSVSPGFGSVFLLLDRLPAKANEPCLHTHNCFTALLFQTTWVSRHQKGKIRKVKPIWIYWSKR